MSAAAFLLLFIAGLVLLTGLTLVSAAFRLGPYGASFHVGEERTPIDVDERTLRLADEVDRLQEELEQAVALLKDFAAEAKLCTERSRQVMPSYITKRAEQYFGRPEVTSNRGRGPVA